MASGRIKGITIEIGGDTTKLDKALTGVDTSLRHVQSDLKDVERRLKLDPSNLELLAEKQRLFADSARETKERISILSTAVSSQVKWAKFRQKVYQFWGGVSPESIPAEKVSS